MQKQLLGGSENEIAHREMFAQLQARGVQWKSGRRRGNGLPLVRAMAAPWLNLSPHRTMKWKGAGNRHAVQISVEEIAWCY